MTANVSVFAQQDITPANYVFSNQASGPYTIDGVAYGWANCINSWEELNAPFAAGAVATRSANFDSFEGGIYVEKWVAGKTDPDFLTTGDAPLEALRKGTNIVDLGGEVGKVLCICGHESDWAPGTQADENAADGTLTFYLKCESGVNTRVRIVYQQYSKSAIAAGDETKTGLNSAVRTTSGVAKAEIKAAPFTDFAKRTPHPTIMGKYVYTFDDTKWRVAEGDYSLGGAFPYRLYMGGVLSPDVVTLIKSITFTQNPDGTASSSFVTYTPDATAIDNLFSGLNKASVTVTGNNVAISNLVAGENVAIYNVNGGLMESFVATTDKAQVTLASGLYLVKTQTGTVKALVK